MSSFDQKPNSAGQPAVADWQQEVRNLLNLGKCKQAVEQAKAQHKQRNTPESEKLLVDAYFCRIEQFQQKGALQDAQTLLKLVQERFPQHAQRLTGVSLQAAAASGNAAELLAPLARGDTSEELKAAVEKAIHRHWTDLPALANASILPADHPLRVAAGALWKAFEAVTSAPVAEEQLSLPEVSRRSPLAAWKLLIRAIAAFYRNDLESSRRALVAIDADSAVHRLVPVLQAMIDGRRATGAAATVLQNHVGRTDEKLRMLMADFERAIGHASPSAFKRTIRDMVQECAEVQPELVEHLRQHISVQCAILQIPAAFVIQAMGPAVHDARFWRLLARGIERHDPMRGAVCWQRFMHHAMHTGLVRSGTLEEAAICRHIAEVLAPLPPEEVAFGRSIISAMQIGEYYRGQPPEVAALKPASDQEVADAALNPMGLFARATEIDPVPETFRQWYAWAPTDREREDVAQRWRHALPKDPDPLLRLSALTERRNALSYALRYLGAAEVLDALNPAVRKARLRLTLGMAWRHFKERKAHLVERDLAALEALPMMQEGDRAGLLAAIRAAWHTLRGDSAEAQEAAQQVVERLSPLVAQAMVDTVWNHAKLPFPDDVLPPSAPSTPSTLADPLLFARAEARAHRLAQDLQLGLVRKATWDAPIVKVLRQDPCPLSTDELIAIGESAELFHHDEQTYLATAAGLPKASGPMAARFLALRAQSLLAMGAHDRVAQCLRAALDLAQQTHDAELLGEIRAHIDRHGPTRQAVARAGGHRLGETLLADILARERAARKYPRDAADARRDVILIDSAPAWRPMDEFDAGPDMVEDDDFDEDDADDDFDDEWDDDPLPISAKDKAALFALLPELVAATMDGRVSEYRDRLERTNPKLAAQMDAFIRMIKHHPEELDALFPGVNPFGGRRRKRR